MQEEISSLQQQLDMLLARSLAGVETATAPTTTTTTAKAARDVCAGQAAAQTHTQHAPKNNSTEEKNVCSYSDIAKAVGKAVTDCTRRSRNVIISGLGEESSSDIDVVTDLFQSVLHIDTRDKIMMLKRLGHTKENIEIQRRPLLVVLSSDTAATEVLSRSYLLKELTDHRGGEHIYINRDLSPEEAKAAFERRQKRREKERLKQ